LLCELSLFVLAVTSRKIDPRSDARASNLKRPVIVPHTAKGANFGLDLCKGVGAFFLPSALSLNLMRLTWTA